MFVDWRKVGGEGKFQEMVESRLVETILRRDDQHSWIRQGQSAKLEKVEDDIWEVLLWEGDGETFERLDQWCYESYDDEQLKMWKRSYKN